MPLTNSMWIITNRETGKIWSTPRGKWSWQMPSAARAAYTYHGRVDRWDVEGPKLGDDACPYRLEEFSTGRERETWDDMEAIKEATVHES